MKNLILALAVAVVGIAAPTVALAERQNRPAVEQIDAPTHAPAAPVGTVLGFVLSAGLALGTVINIRATQDLNNTVVVNLPAAGASATTPVLDLFTTTAGRIPGVELGVILPATPNLADAKTVTLTVKDSDDGITFAAVSAIPAIVVTGDGGDGADAIAPRYKLPIDVRRYLRLDIDVLAAGGANTDVEATLALFF